MDIIIMTITIIVIMIQYFVIIRLVLIRNYTN